MTDTSQRDATGSGLPRAGRAWALALFTLVLFPGGAQASDEGDAHEDRHPRHRHHVAVLGGVAFEGSETAAVLGADYAFHIVPSFGLGVAYEETFGDFELQAFFVAAGFRPGGGPLKLGAGVGVERKLASGKRKAIMFVSGGYDFHVGRITLTPEANLDFVEGGARVFSVALAVGAGF